MVFNSIYEYYEFLGKVDKINKVIRPISGYNKDVVKKCKEYYNKGRKTDKRKDL